MALKALVLLLLLGTAAAPAAKRLNVLMVAIDDLRTEISPYPEGAHMHTPAFQKLASESVVFERCYVQVAVCAASRTALLTSRWPDTSKTWTIEDDQYWRFTAGNFTTLPQLFKEAGYLTLGMGKIFHEGAQHHNQDANYSWSPEALYPDYLGTGEPGIYDPKGSTPGVTKGDLAHIMRNEDEPVIQDGLLTTHAVQIIQNLSRAADSAADSNASDTRPFFLAVGLHKPHTPWYAPKKYFDLYPPSTVDVAPRRTPPIGVPPVAMQTFIKGRCHDGGDLKRAGCEKLGPGFPMDGSHVNNATALYMRRAYRAASSFTDANLGKVLDALAASPRLAASTVRVLWSDHGWQLGDNDLWSKMTNFEHAVRIPMMVSAPGIAPGRSSATVMEMDLLPTIVSLAGIGVAVPACPIQVMASRAIDLCTDGHDLIPLLRDPTHGSWDHPAFGQFPRPEHPNKGPDLTNTSVNKMGYTVRTNSYRYTEWVSFNRDSARADWSTVWGVELYNHSDSPVPVSFDMEFENIAALPQSKGLVAQLHDLLKRQFTTPLPPLPPPGPPVPPPPSPGPKPAAGFTEHTGEFCSSLDGGKVVFEIDAPALAACAQKCRDDSTCKCFDINHKKCRGIDQVSLKHSGSGMNAYVKTTVAPGGRST